MALPKTKQQIFDTVATHLFTQGKPAISSNGRCQYRTAEGLMCAAGVLIPDKQYNEQMEGKTSDHLISRFPLPAIFKKHEDLIVALQVLHDEEKNWESTAVMREALDELARDNKIDPSILTTLQFSDR